MVGRGKQGRTEEWKGGEESNGEIQGILKGTNDDNIFIYLCTSYLFDDGPV